jgi:hypothetical protein
MFERREVREGYEPPGELSVGGDRGISQKLTILWIRSIDRAQEQGLLAVRREDLHSKLQESRVAVA